MQLSDFRTGFPEFNGVTDGMVQMWLNAAQLRIDQGIWGAFGTSPNLTNADFGHGYLAAHLLATSPFGQNARMVAKEGSTTYWQNYVKYMRLVSSGYRVC